MLYHYYMKINYTFLIAGLLALTFLPGAYAQVTVVKQDGNKIYLDTSEYNRTVAAGDSFKIILSQEKLTNPKTGKDLGLLNHYSPEGKIIEVQDLYAVGELPAGTKISIGQEAVIHPAAAAMGIPAAIVTAANTSATQATPAAAVSNRKVISYPVIEREIISAVKADLTARPGEEFAALDIKGNLILYTADESNLQELATHKLTTGFKPITLSALDLMGTGHAQLFASVYKENEQKISTLVFDLQDQEFKQVAALPYFVKEIGCAQGKELYGQKAFISGPRPADARKLSYEQTRFKMEKDGFATRGNWLSGVNQYEIQNAETDNFVYTTGNGRLRMRLKNGKFTDSPALFAATPNRVKYKQEIVSFYPSIQVYGPKGHATLAGIENTSKLGILSEQFGQYNGGKIHFLAYDNGALTVQETLPLAGFAYDTNCTAHGILVPQVLSGGQTVLTEIYR